MELFMLSKNNGRLEFRRARYHNRTLLTNYSWLIAKEIYEPYTGLLKSMCWYNESAPHHEIPRNAFIFLLYLERVIIHLRHHPYWCMLQNTLRKYSKTMGCSTDSTNKWFQTIPKRGYSSCCSSQNHNGYSNKFVFWTNLWRHNIVENQHSARYLCGLNCAKHPNY